MNKNYINNQVEKVGGRGRDFSLEMNKSDLIFHKK